MTTHRAGLTRRRSVLAAALAAPLLVTGCAREGFGALGTPPSPAPDVGLLTGAIEAERLLIARYQAALTALPALTGRLAPLLAEHRDHLRALTARLLPGATRPTPAASPPRPAIPAAPAAATAYLGAAEQASAEALLDRLPAVSSPSLAQLLASIAAAETTHAAALGLRSGLA